MVYDKGEKLGKLMFGLKTTGYELSEIIVNKNIIDKPTEDLEAIEICKKRKLKRQRLKGRGKGQLVRMEKKIAELLNENAALISEKVQGGSMISSVQL